MEQKGIKGKDYFFGIRYLFTALIIFKKLQFQVNYIMSF